MLIEAPATDVSVASPPSEDTRSLVSLPNDVFALVMSSVALTDVRGVAWFGATCRPFSIEGV